MPTNGLLRPTGNASRCAPAEWVIWAIDQDGVFLILEGPGLLRSRVEPSACLGCSIWDVYQENPGVLTYVRRALSGPATAELVFNGCRFWDSAVPLPGGGAVGLGLALDPVAEVPPDAGERVAPRVAELARPIPELGGAEGDLLVWNPERPGVVGLYREISLDGLSPAVAQELLRLTNGSASAASGAAPAPGDTPPPPPARASHLRLLP